MNGTASLADREIGRVLPANSRKVLFSGAAKDTNEAASAAYFGGSKVRESIKRQLVREVNRAAICSEFCSVQPVIEWEPHEAACSAHSLGITQV
jgi:hypothetical protein